MEFGHGFPNVASSSRPSVLGQHVLPVNSNMSNTTGGWLQTTPAHMPWGISQPSLVHFTGEQTTFTPASRIGFHRNFHNSHIKRKIDPEPEVMPMPKLHITEEKMAAHMSQLRIGPAPTVSGQDMMEEEPLPRQAGNEDNLMRLYMCEEIKRYTDEILPSSILCKLQKPSTALMLWQPPGAILSQPLADSVSRDRARRAMEDERRERELDESHSVDNNNSTSVDLNSLLRTLSYNGPATSAEDAMDL